MTLTILLLLLVSFAFTNDLSALQCTANDIRIVGSGTITNEPCQCSGSFNASVIFTLENNAASDRYCVTLHICPGLGSTFEDVILTRAATGKTTSNFSATIPFFPCGAGLVCFGIAGSEAGGIFPKGAPCPPGQCCSTISYNVKASDPCPDTTPQIPSKCRHQQICIQGRGVASLTCPNGCVQPCGGSIDLNLCAIGGLAPFTFSLSDGFLPVGAPVNNCQMFHGTISVAKDLIGTVTDRTGCSRNATIHVTVQDLPQIQGITQTPNLCDGGVRFDVQGGTNTGQYTWSVDGVQKQSSSSRTFDFLPSGAFGVCHSVNVTGMDGLCNLGSAVAKFVQCVKTVECSLP